MFKNWFPMMLTNLVNVTPQGKDPYTVLTLVSPDTGDSTKIYTRDKLDFPMKRWSWYEFEIEISMNGDKTYKNLHGVRNFKDSAAK